MLKTKLNKAAAQSSLKELNRGFDRVRMFLLKTKHDLFSWEVSKTTKENTPVCWGLWKFKDATKQLQVVILLPCFLKPVRREDRCYTSQEHGGHHDSQTSLQAVVTNDQLLASQLTHFKDLLPVKTCHEDGGKQREHGKPGQRSNLNAIINWETCTGIAVLQFFHFRTSIFTESFWLGL